ncbi:hypothetical protein SS50377_26818 [Spironucleus salmonicida]|uniref:Uncharacterized protein n=1 Tax=Spironucleus salmonicida TaxID=348837 RepID=V6LXD0_9EUKA|nr:hypothetical protein SS50377_26818 [Spironucleus salmonicida]|eukprot:EST49287.1 Hypothetical protein SS50377_10510 [Spironucleus salmonicida]
MSAEKFSFTIQLIGAKNAGKRSLINRYCNSQYVRSDVPEKTEITYPVIYNNNSYTVTVNFEHYETLPNMLKNYQIICVDLREPQKIIDDQICKLTRQLQFKTTQNIPILGLCTDKQISTVRGSKAPFCEVSAFTGAGVKPFFGSIVWGLLKAQIEEIEAEIEFQNKNFNVVSFDNKNQFKSEDYVEFLTKFELPAFFKDLVMQICDKRPENVLEFCMQICESK